MKLHPLVHSRPAFALACGLALSMGILSLSAKADEWDKKTVLTINQPVQVRDTLLQPGQYVFKLYNSSSDRHVVQIFNRDESRIIDTVLAIPAQRMEPAGHSQFTFWETPTGTAAALRDWYYPGDTIGQEFPYPKHPEELAMVTPPEAAAPAPQAETAQPEEQPETSTSPQAMTEEPPAAEQPVETAQSTPPPAPEQTPPPAASPEPQPEQQQTPQELPKTASPYPLIGLSGMILLGLSGLLRLKRSA